VVHRVGRGIALLFHDRGTRRGVSGQRHALAALYPWERPGTHCTGSWVGPRVGLDGRKISSPPAFDPAPSSRSQSLYRLSYPAHIYIYIYIYIYIRSIVTQYEYKVQILNYESGKMIFFISKTLINEIKIKTFYFKISVWL